MRSGKFQSGCRAVTGDVEAVGGRLLAVGNAVGAGVGVQECLWGRVRAGVLGGGYPPPFKRFPAGGITFTACVHVEKGLTGIQSVGVVCLVRGIAHCGFRPRQRLLRRPGIAPPCGGRAVAVGRRGMAARGQRTGAVSRRKTAGAWLQRPWRSAASLHRGSAVLREGRAAALCTCAREARKARAWLHDGGEGPENWPPYSDAVLCRLCL